MRVSLVALADSNIRVERIATQTVFKIHLRAGLLQEVWKPAASARDVSRVVAELVRVRSTTHRRPNSHEFSYNLMSHDLDFCRTTPVTAQKKSPNQVDSGSAIHVAAAPTE
jgi:hypothetical protein